MEIQPNEVKKLKSVRLGRAENLPEEERKKLGIEKGLIAIETWEVTIPESPAEKLSRLLKENDDVSK